MGMDQVSVDLLRRVAVEQSDALCQMCTDVLQEGCFPVKWGVSLLALLPKCQQPRCAGDLRPIRHGECGHETDVENRHEQNLRGTAGSFVLRRVGQGNVKPPISSGRSPGLRDVTREWRTGVVAVKLDVKGAFDYIDRGCVATFLEERLADAGVPFELRFLLGLLAENKMTGTAPGRSDRHCRRQPRDQAGEP